MSKPTDGDVLNEMFTGENAADESELLPDVDSQLKDEELLEQERRTSGSFSESQARLARAIDGLTALAKPHL